MGLLRSKNLGSARDTCDIWFSKYVRLRDANHNGLCKCVTCNTIKPWNEMDCGHFQSRRYMSTRYEEKNAHAQCQKCNNYNSGEQYRHGIEIDFMYGEGSALELEKQSRNVRKYIKQELMELAQYYKQEAEAIAKEKVIQI